MKESRLRIIKRWVRRYKIEVCVPPKVRLTFHQANGKISVKFGNRYERYLIDRDLYWTKEGLPTPEYKKYYTYFSGWMTDLDDWRLLWKYIRECYIDGVIHDMDLIKP